MDAIENSKSMAQEVAQAASNFHKQRTGHAPRAVSVVLCEHELLITLHDGLSKAEKILATNPVGAAQLQEFHRQLFATSSLPLSQEIRRITGVEVRQAEVENSARTAVQVFSSGTIVQIFVLAQSISMKTWNLHAIGEQP